MTTTRSRASEPIDWLTWAIAALFALLYGPVLWHWVDGWLNKTISIEHEYFSHGLIGLPFAAYLAWQRRPQWLALPTRSNPIGGVLMGLAAVLYLSNVADCVNLSLPILLAGLCLWLRGMAGLKGMAFPLILTALATPTDVPYLITPYTLPLQAFIAGTAGIFLQIIGLSDVVVDGIYLRISGRVVEVAPYCAGLKMLFTTLYVGLMMLHWTGLSRSRSRSLGLLGGGVLISVTANIIRNTILSFMHGTQRDAAFHWFHDSWGGDLFNCFMLGSLLLLLLGIEKYWPLDLSAAGVSGAIAPASDSAPAP